MNNDDSASAEPANSRRASATEADDESGVDGRHAKLDQPLHDGETVAVFPPIAGG